MALLYLVLLIPIPETVIEKGSEKQPFEWKQDDRWQELEKQFLKCKSIGSEKLAPTIIWSLNNGNSLLDSISTFNATADSPLFTRLEENAFSSAVMIGAFPEHFNDYQSFVVRLRNVIKTQSLNWDMSSTAAQISIYRLLYGARAALEEIMLQRSPDSLAPLLQCSDEPSATPFTRILGVTIHSGDILISRGGAPTSALIARGNNFQGNFSHAALVYVDSATSIASIIESHIEKGVAIASLQDYLNDKKLRVMVLRLRHDLPQLKADPMLPHKVAKAMLDDAKNRHIPYDFAMDSNDDKKMFCSEVVYDPYKKAGITLWSKLTHISSPGVVSWLAAFGVTHFDTQAPSDLEYDPQVKVVAEWRDIETLYKDHVDNAVIDALLEGADKGERLKYNSFLLPVGRVMKLYCWILNRFNKIGPVPEGMNAESALRNKYLSSMHAKIKARVLQLADQFQTTNGYRPPYWELYRLAQQAKKEYDSGE